MADIKKALRDVLDAMATDVELLVRLHGQEPDLELLQNLAKAPASTWFALVINDKEAEVGFALLDSHFRQVKDFVAAQELLAVEFADIYLTFAKRVAPNESYWLSEDHIERQEPMFVVREWYAHYGLKAQDWRKLPDDHLVSELSFVAALLRDGRDHALLDAGRFLDRHLLLWSEQFFAGVVDRADTRFFAGLAIVTQAALQTIRSNLENITGETRAAVVRSKIPSSNDVEAAFVPGMAPSW